MGKVTAGMTISLGGFINDAKGSVGRLYGDLKAMQPSAFRQQSIRETGAVVMGRRAFEMGDPNDYADHYAYQVPVFILTHHMPEYKPTANHNLSFHFVRAWKLPSGKGCRGR